MRLAQRLRRTLWPTLPPPIVASQSVTVMPRTDGQPTSVPAVLDPHTHDPAIAKATSRPWRRLSLRPLSFMALVIFPTATAASYYFGIAADQYVAEFRFTLSSADTPRFDPMSLLTGNSIQSPAALESQILVQYINSRAIIDKIDASLDLRRLFSSPQADWWSRLTQPASAEELLRYWKGQIDAFFDPANGTVMVRARAFAPADALRLSETIVTACEKLVNELSLRARNDALHHAEGELARAESRLKSVLGEIRAFRDREGLIDPGENRGSLGATRHAVA